MAWNRIVFVWYRMQDKARIVSVRRNFVYDRFASRLVDVCALMGNIKI